MADKNGYLQKLYGDATEVAQDADGQDDSEEAGGKDTETKSHYDRSSVITVGPDQQIFRVMAPVPGKDGADVYGGPIPRKLGREVQFRLGSNVEQQGEFIVATCGGKLALQAGLLHAKYQPHGMARGDVSVF